MREIVSVPKAYGEPTLEQCPTQAKVRLEWATFPIREKLVKPPGAVDSSYLTDSVAKIKLEIMSYLPPRIW